MPRCAPHLLLSASLASAGRGGRRGCCCVVRNQSSPQRGAFPTRQHGPSSFRAASPERRQRGGEHAALHALCYLYWKQKALSSPGQRLVPGKKKAIFPSYCLLVLRQQEPRSQCHQQQRNEWGQDPVWVQNHLGGAEVAGAGFEQSCVHLSWSLLLVKVLRGAQGGRAGGEAGLGAGRCGSLQSWSRTFCPGRVVAWSWAGSLGGRGQDLLSCPEQLYKGAFEMKTTASSLVLLPSCYQDVCPSPRLSEGIHSGSGAGDLCVRRAPGVLEQGPQAPPSVSLRLAAWLFGKCPPALEAARRPAGGG